MKAIIIISLAFQLFFVQNLVKNEKSSENKTGFAEKQEQVCMINGKKATSGLNITIDGYLLKK